MKVFKEYCDHLKKEVESMMHDVMQDEAPHIDELMIIGEMVDQMEDLYCIMKMHEGGDEHRGGGWDKE